MSAEDPERAARAAKEVARSHSDCIEEMTGQAQVDSDDADGELDEDSVLAGRLMGEWIDGDFVQIGDNLTQGLQHAIGRVVHRITFPAGKPLGIDLLPLGNDCGAVVNQIEPGSAAEQLGEGGYGAPRH